MRSESSEYTWKAKVLLIDLENYLEEHAQKLWMYEKHVEEIWERNRMNSDMHIAWWNEKTQKKMEMILMVLREQSEEHDQSEHR